MERLIFDSEGRLISIDEKKIEDSELGINYDKLDRLQTSDSLGFLHETEIKAGNVFEKDYWSLYQNGIRLEPLRFSNGKTQEDIVKEIYDLINEGNKIIFLHGACGTGKSAIALNLARVIGKASIVVPVKALQTQYEKDYTSGKYLIKPSGEKMKIALMTESILSILLGAVLLIDTDTNILGAAIGSNSLSQTANLSWAFFFIIAGAVLHAIQMKK